jgi:hypothetical protein
VSDARIFITGELAGVADYRALGTLQAPGKNKPLKA